jgi:hypothetical protein
MAAQRVSFTVLTEAVFLIGWRTKLHILSSFWVCFKGNILCIMYTKPSGFSRFTINSETVNCLDVWEDSLSRWEKDSHQGLYRSASYILKISWVLRTVILTLCLQRWIDPSPGGAEEILEDEKSCWLAGRPGDVVSGPPAERLQRGNRRQNVIIKILSWNNERSEVKETMAAFSRKLS